MYRGLLFVHTTYSFWNNEATCPLHRVLRGREEFQLENFVRMLESLVRGKISYAGQVLPDENSLRCFVNLTLRL